MNTAHHILVVDDDRRIGETLCDVLRKSGYHADLAANGGDGLAALRGTPVDAVLLDMLLPDIHGLEVLAEMRRIAPDLPVIMVTAHGDVATAVTAVKTGAYDFLEKPVDVDQVLLRVEKAVETRALVVENRRLVDSLRRQYPLVGRSAAMARVMEQIRLLAPQDCSILITGDSGTGKELVARALHAHSPRVSGPFIKINCPGIPRELLESELFGHVRGAFTGAHRDARGKVAAADGGTLFFDEIGELEMALQPKLLQALEDRRFYPVGSHEEISVDVRVISATNRDLEAAMGEGRFREDLYYRLRTTEIRIPPLRERPEDIPDLVRYYLSALCDDLNRRPVEVSAAAMTALVDFPWPGNVRELKQKMHEMLLYHRGETLGADFATEMLRRGGSGGAKLAAPPRRSLRVAREDFERDYIRRALIACEGNVQETASALGIERTNLYRKMRKLGMDGD